MFSCVLQYFNPIQCLTLNFLSPQNLLLCIHSSMIWWRWLSSIRWLFLLSNKAEPGFTVALYLRQIPGFSLGLNDRAQRPVVLFSALSFFLGALSFFQSPVIFREPFGFFGLSSALFWAWSCRKRPIKAKGGAIFVHHVVVRVRHWHHLGFTMNITLYKLACPVVFQDWLEHCILFLVVVRSRCVCGPLKSCLWRTTTWMPFAASSLTTQPSVHMWRMFTGFCTRWIFSNKVSSSLPLHFS